MKMSVSEKSLLKLSEAIRDVKVCCDFICDSRNTVEEIFHATWDLGSKLRDLEEYRIPEDNPMPTTLPPINPVRFVQWNVHNWPEVHKFIVDPVSNMKHYVVDSDHIITIDTEGGYSLIIKPKNWIYKNDAGQLYGMTTPSSVS